MISALAIYANGTEFSRYEPDNRVVKVRVVPTPTTAPAEKVTVSLTRKDGYVLASQEIDFLTGDFPKGGVVSFDLSSFNDSNGFPLFTTGEYQIQAKSQHVEVATNMVVSLVTVSCLKRNYCVGLPLKQMDVLVAVKQPSLVTGVTIKSVSGDTAPGIGILAYKTDSPATLQWNNGAVVELTATSTEEILPDDMGNYITVDIDTFELPASDSAEGIIIDYGTIDDATLRREINNAVAELQRAIGSFLEPKRIATSPYYENPEAGEYFDAHAQTAHFFRRDAFSPSSLAWRINLPYVNVQSMDILEGYFGGNKVLELQHGVFALNRKTGCVEILPKASELSYIVTFFTQLNYWGIRESITDFWRFKAIVGVPENDGPKDDLLKAVGFMAAIPILSMAGQALRGGRQSESMSKDGVSRSSSTGGNGVYGATISQYQEWLKSNKSELRKKYGSIAMATL